MEERRIITIEMFKIFMQARLERLSNSMWSRSLKTEIGLAIEDAVLATNLLSKKILEEEKIEER